MQRKMAGMPLEEWISGAANRMKKGYDSRRNPLVFLVGHVGFEPSTS